jgi:hypothetical protein
MRGKRFVIYTLLLTSTACIVISAINWYINFYGIFGNVRGQSRIVTASERQTKYLYSFNYIPDNFDALLVGSSIAGNLDTSRVHGVHMYNAALSGGNITEEKLIAENALHRGHFSRVVFCLNPYLVATHGRKAGGMENRDVWATLGSTELFSSYIGAIMIRLGLIQGRFTADGKQDFEVLHRQEKILDNLGGRKDAAKPVASQKAEFKLDKTALEELSALAELARSQGASIVWMFAPVYLPEYQAQRSGYEKFENRIRRISKPGELIINMNDGSFNALTSQSRSFSDGVHLSNDGALATVDALDRALGGAKP